MDDQEFWDRAVIGALAAMPSPGICVAMWKSPSDIEAIANIAIKIADHLLEKRTDRNNQSTAGRV